jgi:hypothetical protein
MVDTRKAPRYRAHLVQFSTSSSPTTLRSILLINSVLFTSAAFMPVIVCFKVLVFEPKTTVPPITAAIAPIRTVGSNPAAPMIVAKIKIPPATMATLEIRMIFRHLSIMSASSSMRASTCKFVRAGHRCHPSEIYPASPDSTTSGHDCLLCCGRGSGLVGTLDPLHDSDPSRRNTSFPAYQIGVFGSPISI